ncbi:MAG: hypothetical protein ACRYF3_05100 [Janthinobacterium lividum]
MPSDDVGEVFLAYLRVNVLRPGALNDDPPSGLVDLAPSAGRGSVPRVDVAAVCVELLDHVVPGRVHELGSGRDPIAAAVSRL